MMTFLITWLHFRQVRQTMKPGENPTMLQLYALAFEIGLIGIVFWDLHP